MNWLRNNRVDVVLTTIVGGVIAGYRSTGSWYRATAPNRIVTTAITFAKIGRSMKNREIMRLWSGG